MRYKIVIVVLVTSVIAMLTVHSAPRLEVVGPDAVDLKTYPANKTKTTFFTIKNSGNEVLKIIKVRTACTCVATSFKNNTLQPGESTKIKVDVLAYEVYKNYSMGVFVHTNDPENSIHKLLVSGNAEPIADIQPQDSIFLGAVKPGNELKEEFIVKAFGKEVLKLQSQAIKIKSTHKMKTKIISETNAYRVIVTYDKDRAPGLIKSEIRIPVIEPKGWKPVKITILGRSLR